MTSVERARGKVLPPPIQVGGGLDQPPMAGKRTLENSPALFPKLSLEGCKFLEGIANVAIRLEEQLSLKLTPYDQNIPYTPPAVKKVVDIAEMLVRKPETDHLNPKKNGSRTTYSLGPVYIAGEFTYNDRGDKIYTRVDMLEMSLSSNVVVSVQPNTIRRTFDPKNGKRLGQFDEVHLTEVKEIRSFQGKSPEDVTLVAESHREIPPTLTITSNGAQLKITFHSGGAVCELSIQGINYNHDSQIDGEQQADDDGESVPLASIKERYVKVVQTVVPLTDFRSSKKPLSQEDVDRWLQNLVSDMAGKVKRY